MGGVQSSSIKRIIFVNSRFNVFHLYFYVLIAVRFSYCTGHAIGKSEKCQDFTFFHGWSAVRAVGQIVFAFTAGQ
jgi:hypothetical protein